MMCALRNAIQDLSDEAVLLTDFAEDEELEDRCGITRSMAPDVD
jgi:hypothetical protein